MPFDLKEEFINRAEQDLNISKFPENYRQFMMLSNGGFFEVGDDDSDEYVGFDLYPIADMSEKKRMKRTFNNVVRETLNSRNNYVSGEYDNYILIGDDGGQGVYLFKINPDRSVDENVWYRAYDQIDDKAERVCQFSL